MMRIEHQRELMTMVRDVALKGGEIGSCLLMTKPFVPHGKFREVIVERFCKPNNIGIRTAERYQSIAKNAARLAQGIRAGTPEFADKMTTRS